MTPCPHCGDPVTFASETGHSPQRAAWIREMAPWNCPGCEAYGTDLELIDCPDCKVTVGPGHFCYRCEDCTERTDGLALTATEGGDVCPVCLAEIIAQRTAVA